MNDQNIPVIRLQLDRNSGVLVEVPLKDLFLKGPIPMDWLSRAARLPGKAINVALAICWLSGMAKNAPVKLTKKALLHFNVSRDAATDGVTRLEDAGLISVERHLGRYHVILILYKQTDPRVSKVKPCRYL